MREMIEQEIGKRFEKIEKTLERTLEKTLEAALKSPAAARAQAAAERAQERITTAKKSLDDVLLGLEHKGYNVKEPQDLIQTVGRRVLERASEIAEDVRSQVAATPYSPEWLKNVTIPRPASATATATASASTVSTVETTVAAASGTNAAGVTAAGATEGDGELAESAEDSAEERSASAVVHSEPDVVTTSLTEASKSDQAADFAPTAKASGKKSSKAAKTKK